MNRWFRWQQVVPRLLLVIIVLLAAQHLLGLAARWMAVRSGEAALGARVEIANARVSIADRQVVLGDIRVANPCRPADNLFEADCCELEFSVGPILHKQAIIDRGRITGLRFGAQRETSEAVADRPDQKPSPTSPWFSDQSDEVAREWLAQIKERFQQNVVDQFNSVHQCEALCAEWPERCAALDKRTKELQRRAAKLQKSSDAAQANRLRHADFLDGVQGKIAALQQDFTNLNAEIETLPQMLDSQRRAIVAARRQDEQLLRERLRMEPIDAQKFTAYFLREQVVRPLGEVFNWLRWTQQIAPAGSPAGRSQKRGEDILFAGCRPSSNFLIRTLQLEGTASVSGQPVELRGLLTDVTTTPARHGQPTRLRLAATGSLPLQLLATLDRTGAVARDELLLDCRGIAMPELCLGRSDQLELTLTPSVGSLSVSVRVEGTSLSGDIQLVQQRVRITPALRGDLSDVPLSAPLADTLGEMNSVATRLSLHGTVNDPSCTMWSNLGPAVAEAMERAQRRAGDEHARAMLADARRQVDERLAGLERQIVDQQTKLASQMTSVTGRLESIARQQSPRERITVEQLGRRLPETSLFR